MTQNQPDRTPNRTTMEGMIANADRVLAIAMSPEGVPPGLFTKCKGVIIISVVEVGFFFSGSVGSGILMAKKEDGSWSSPSACGLTGVGWGFQFGGSLKDIIIFLMTEDSVKNAACNKGIKMGGQAEVALGPIGRTAQGNIGVGQNGKIGSTVAIGFSKGAFLSLSIAGAVVGTRDKANKAFYDRTVTATEIMFEDVPLPAGRTTMIDDVYTKLTALVEAGSES